MHPILLNDRRVQQWRLGLEQEVAHILPRYQVALPGINAAPERAMAVGRRRGRREWECVSAAHGSNTLRLLPEWHAVRGRVLALADGVCECADWSIYLDGETETGRGDVR